MKISKILLALFVSFFLIQCGSSGGTTASGTTFDNATALTGYASCTAASGEAVICGTVSAADGVTPIIGTEIRYATPSGDISPLKGLRYGNGVGKGIADATKCITDSNGTFACGGITSSGTYSFYIYGSGVDMSFSEAVTTDSTTNVAASKTTVSSGDTTNKWLVVIGSWDGVQLLLSQLKGCTLTGADGSAENTTSSSECVAAGLDVISVSDAATTFAALANITQYQSIFFNCDNNSMSAYATVLQQYVAQGGNIYFSDWKQDDVTAIFPGKITFADNSTSGGDATLDIDDSGLRTYIGTSTMDVTFDLGLWYPMSTVASGVTTYISGNTSSRGGPTDGPITVSWKEGSGGCIFYTSYHVEGASTGSSQEKALKYLVQNISEVCQ